MSPSALLRLVCVSLLIGAFVFAGLVTHDVSEWASSSAGFAAALLNCYSSVVRLHEVSARSLAYRRYPGLGWFLRTIGSPGIWLSSVLAGASASWLMTGAAPAAPDRWLLGAALVTLVFALLLSHARETARLESRRSMVKELLFSWAKAARPELARRRTEWVASEAWLFGLSDVAADLGVSEARFGFDALDALHWFQDSPRCAVPDHALRAQFAGRYPELSSTF